MTSFLEPASTTRRAQGFRGRRARLGRQAGSEHLGASLFELEPGKAPFPLHYHLGNEELLIVLSGTTVLRTPEGERELDGGRGRRASRPARRAPPGGQPRPRARRDPDRQRDERSRRRRAPRVGQAQRLRRPAGQPGRLPRRSTTAATRSSSGTASAAPAARTRRDRAGRSRGRRDDGRRDRPARLPRRLRDPALRPGPEALRARSRAPARGPRTRRRARPLDRGRGRGRRRAGAPRRRARRPRRLRAGDRGGAGAARAQARAVRGGWRRPAPPTRCWRPTPRRSR